MEYNKILSEYGAAMASEGVVAVVAKCREMASRNYNVEVYKRCYSSIDLTSLNVTDSVESIAAFADKCVAFPLQFSDIPNVASICVYPNFVETVGLSVGESRIGITAVAGGFPSSQSFIEVKMLEVAMAVENGADEVDVVMNVGDLMSGQYEVVGSHLEMMCEEADGATFKVIIESGALKSPELIRSASLVAMAAGADFIKTSTGKTEVSATPEAAVVMCQAIKDYSDKTGRMVGFKVAGGVKSAEDAALYYTIVEEILGEEWLTPELFRIGASSAANNILSAILGEVVTYY